MFAYTAVVGAVRKWERECSAGGAPDHSPAFPTRGEVDYESESPGRDGRCKQDRTSPSVNPTCLPTLHTQIPKQAQTKGGGFCDPGCPYRLSQSRIDLSYPRNPRLLLCPNCYPCRSVKIRGRTCLSRLVTRLCVLRPIPSDSTSINMLREAKGLVSLGLNARHGGE
jgi:hypothetical protein